MRPIQANDEQNSDPKMGFACPACGKRAKAARELAGKKVMCPHCTTVVRVPRGPELQSIRGTPQPVEAAGPGTVTDQPGAREREKYSFLAPPQMPDELGRLGPYRVLAVLGVGGMGVVFRAEDPQLNRLVALKAMLPSVADASSSQQRFLREARAAAAIKHDHIVSVYQVGEDRGVPFLAMEFLEGEPLDKRLTREGKLPVSDVLRFGREIALGLAAAHKRGLIHRDIKPANLWLDAETGRIKVLDFGLARVATESSPLTQSGAIVGTPEYMSPEQVQGQKLDERCDLFSLGCVLYQMSTGKTPFKGSDMVSTLMAVATANPQAPCEVEPRVPPALSKLILRLLAKEPNNRPESAEAVAASMRNLLDRTSDGLGTADEKPARPWLKWFTERRPPARWLIAMSGGLAAAVLTGILYFWQTPPRVVQIDRHDPDIDTAIAEIEAAADNASPAEPPPKTLINSIGMKLLWVAPGTFSMGYLETAENNDNEPKDTELPQHSVTIGRPFYLAAYKTTQAEFEEVLGRNPSHFSAGGAGNKVVAGIDTARFPVEQVSFFDAIEFCIKLSERENLRPCYQLEPIQRAGSGSIPAARVEVLSDGTGYRLPSEAEWEYCARAGTSMRYSCGNDPAKVGDYAWFYSNSGYRSHPVGEKKPNAWGFYDLGSMLHEWCEDPWHPNYQGAPTDGSAWYEGGDKNSRVTRGGCYKYRVWCCRSAVRYPNSIHGATEVAFRVARVCNR